MSLRQHQEKTISRNYAKKEASLRRVYPVWATLNAFRFIQYVAKISKENVIVVCNNGNKSVLLLRSANYRSCKAVAKGGEENIGQKFHLFIIQKPFDKARNQKDYFFITILLPDI